MFRPIAEARGGGVSGAARLNFTFDGRPLTGRAGDTVAAALLANGIVACRETSVSETPRAPYCLMGVCFDCLVVIDGIGNRQGCLVPLAEGMQIETQHGRRHFAEAAR